MNGLALRINKGGAKKKRNQVGFAPLTFTSFINETFDKKNILFNELVQCSTADEQLMALKKILERHKDDCDVVTMKFLVVVFFEAQAKHPVKCFLTRHITKNDSIQQSFSTALALHIVSCLHKTTDYKHYTNIVTKLTTCIENFPAGTAAVKMVEVPLADYLVGCLHCCVGTLRGTKTLSPTEKNEIFNLAHSALRLLLYIVQKVSDDNITHMFKDIRIFIKELMFDEDTPMDTKSVCGILYLSMHVLENGSESWGDILEPNQINDELSQLLSIEASQLSLYSAIATVVSMDRLQQRNVDGQCSIIVLTLKILAIAERSSSETVFILGATRTLLQISKGLNKVADSEIGQRLIDSLLIFIWSHLEHHMDSVRHLTAQALGQIVTYCTRLERDGDSKPLDKLFVALSSLAKSRKSYYVCVTSLAAQLGAVRLLARVPRLVQDVMAALALQAVQASATTALETLLQKHTQETNTETVYRTWIEPVLEYVAANTLESAVLNILENLLARAVKLDEGVINYILPHIKQSSDSSHYDVKCILMLLTVARKSGVMEKLSSVRNEGEWKGIISYDVLKMAAVDAVEETRILSISVIVESPKTTEVFSEGDLNLVLWYLRYNINAQSPNFRQHTLSIMKKFTKRFEDSYKVLIRKDPRPLEYEYYVKFIEEVRAQCFDSLMPGANYSRRVIALQMLVWCEDMHLEGYVRIWKEEYIEKLLLHLEDSYENNKAFALEILKKCPVEMLQKTSRKSCVSLEIEDVLKQASSLKPTECVSASYKLHLIKDKLAGYVLQGSNNDVSEPVTYALLHRLHAELCRELAICEESIVSGAIRAPMYGLLHCMGHLISRVDVCAISNDAKWTALVSDIVNSCVEVNATVSGVVNNSSPEGHLPMDMGEVVVNDHGNSGGVRLEDGRQVTAQMVLLCAWRSVKEVSLLLGEISSRLTIAGEGEPGGSLTHQQMWLMGEHFTKLLAETKHRGAFEQAYVGFTKLLARLWRCRSPALHGRPGAWLRALTGGMEAGRGAGLQATRRSAGLPFMIQALVTTELQVQGNPKCFHDCMTTLLRLASTTAQTEGAIETRTHCINILRALFRNAALEDSVRPHVGSGLRVALRGFGGGTWMERNSSTLLFSALMVRVFGVQRSRDADNLCLRNRMTGRIFFLRYPLMYDYMLEKLKEMSCSEDTQMLRPALYPILLLLARLYPSSLEGTISNLKLVAYIPHVLSCASSGVLKTRQLAAKAMVPLVSPDRYVAHLEAMFTLVGDRNIKRNYCHGILLQVIRLVDSSPESVAMDSAATERLQGHVATANWIFAQAMGQNPCYLLVDEYVKVINLVVWRFPTLIQQDTANDIMIYLDKMLFTNELVTKMNSGREICLSNAIYLYFIMLNKYNRSHNLCEVVNKGLSHKSYEVILSALDYLLILYKNLDVENKFHEHLLTIANEDVLTMLKNNPDYIQSLSNVLKTNKYLECVQKTLKVLTLEEHTEKYVVEIKNEDSNITDEVILNTLFNCVQNEHENLTHIYLVSLANFVTRKLKDSSINAAVVLEVIRVIFACSSSDNSDNIRSVVVGFLEKNCEELVKLDLGELKQEEKFEYKATLFAAIVRVLEDDDAALRQRTSNIITRVANRSQGLVISSKSAEVLREIIEKDDVPVLIVLALLDFKSEVCLSDEVSDECRVFDQNERYNIYLEETTWTCACADRIVQICKKTSTNVVEFVQTIVNNQLYRSTFDKLCNNNLRLFESYLQDEKCGVANDAVNPKIGLFVDRLSS